MGRVFGERMATGKSVVDSAMAREAMSDGSGGSVYNTRGPLVVDF